MSELTQSFDLSCLMPSGSENIVKLGHGSGGRMTTRLIENIFLPVLGNDILNELEDAALINIAGANIAMTTDSYVVSPIFFPGGDIGSLAVHGTINDLSMRGARPLCLSAAFIMEEGLPIADLEKIVKSFQQACLNSGTKLITADTKVVNKGAADKLFITTTGIGIVEKFPAPSVKRAQAGDCVLISGDIGRHGIAIMASREGLDLETTIESDSYPLHNLVWSILNDSNEEGYEKIHCLRDITRGGLAGVLNEIANASNVGIEIREDSIPIHQEVKAVCEILGLDPLYVACEGRLVSVVTANMAEEIVSIMSKHEAASGCMMIGRVVADHPGRVVLRSKIGGNRIVDLLSGEQLPRIC